MLIGKWKNGIAVYASSSDDEVSRLGSNGNHSMFTGALSTAMISQSIVHKGQIALEDIYRETQRLVHAWNIKNPGKEQHPIYRSSMGGTAYFKVMEYKPYEPEQISVENEKYIVTNVKPLSTTSEKRLSAFVILKIEASTDELVSITKEIAESIKYANVYSSEKSAALHANMPAKAVRCYFGMDENDMVNHTHAYYTIWAVDDVKSKYYRDNTNAEVVDGIYIFKNTSYDLVRKMQEHVLYIHNRLPDKRNLNDKGIDFERDILALAKKQFQFGSVNNYLDEWINFANSIKLKSSQKLMSKKSLIDNLKEIYYTFSKKLSMNYDVLSKFIDENKTKITEVIVLGHSMLGVDEPYYRDVIVPKLKDVHWDVYWHKFDDASIFIEKYKLPEAKSKEW